MKWGGHSNEGSCGLTPVGAEKGFEFLQLCVFRKMLL